MLPRPREATPTDTTLHYTTLFRCGVGGRAATLAEDLPLVGEADDVLDGEEEGLVPELGDQRQFVFDLFHDLRGCTLGPAPAHAGFGELAQMRSRDRKSTRLNSSHSCASRMPSSACKQKHFPH